MVHRASRHSANRHEKTQLASKARALLNCSKPSCQIPLQKVTTIPHIANHFARAPVTPRPCPVITIMNHPTQHATD
jgi:hypothetical protein